MIRPFKSAPPDKKAVRFLRRALNYRDPHRREVAARAVMAAVNAKAVAQ